MKHFIAKIYDNDGTTFDSVQSDILNIPSFSKTRNGGLGECRLALPYVFGKLASKLGKIVKIYMINSDNPTGKLIYTGFVSRQREILQSGSQTVELTLLGIQAQLMNAYYKTGGGAYSVTHSTADVSAILEAIIDHFQTVYASALVTYTASSIDSVGTNVNYTFDQKKWYQAIEEAYKLAGSGWYWYINESGVLHFHENPGTATHKFTIGKDIENIEAERNIEQLINLSYLNYNGGTDSDSDATSQSDYGVYENYTDIQNITDSTTASEFTDKEVTDNKNLKIRTKLTINSEYDIESINAGDTCRILNKDFDSSVFNDNMTIHRIEYYGEKAVLHLEDYTFLHKEISKINS